MVGVCWGKGDVQQDNLRPNWQVNLHNQCADSCAGAAIANCSAQCREPFEDVLREWNSCMSSQR